MDAATVQVLVQVIEGLGLIASAVVGYLVGGWRERAAWNRLIDQGTIRAPRTRRSQAFDYGAR